MAGTGLGGELTSRNGAVSRILVGSSRASRAGGTGGTGGSGRTSGAVVGILVGTGGTGGTGCTRSTRSTGCTGCTLLAVVTCAAVRIPGISGLTRGRLLGLLLLAWPVLTLPAVVLTIPT